MRGTFCVVGDTRPEDLGPRNLREQVRIGTRGRVVKLTRFDSHRVMREAGLAAFWRQLVNVTS